MYKVEKTFNVLNGVVPNFKKTKLLSNYIIEQMKTDLSIEEFHHEATSQTKELTDYRYTGKDPNNYVCFGNEETTCPKENLYRIIGVIPTQNEVNGEYENRVKLIKNTLYTETQSGYLRNTNLTSNKKGYCWNYINENKWENSLLNLKVLNGVFWNNLDDYQNYLAKSIWYLGAFKNDASQSPENFYTIERSNKNSLSGGLLNYNNNIGLLYPSDYGFSLGNEYKNKKIYDNRNMYMNSSWLAAPIGYELTITPNGYDKSSSGYYAVAVISHDIGYISGAVTADSPNVAAGNIRPTFYLRADVLYNGGNGSSSDPYRITK